MGNHKTEHFVLYKCLECASLPFISTKNTCDGERHGALALNASPLQLSAYPTLEPTWGVKTG